MLGLTGFLETLPFIIFGLFAGAVADAFDRKKVLLVTMVVQLVPSVAMALLTYTDTVQVWHIYALGFLGVLWMSLTGPRALRSCPRLVPPGPHDERGDYQFNDYPDTVFWWDRPSPGYCIDHTGLAMTYSISTLLWCPLSPYPFAANLWQTRR